MTYLDWNCLVTFRYNDSLVCSRYRSWFYLLYWQGFGEFKLIWTSSTWTWEAWTFTISVWNHHSFVFWLSENLLFDYQPKVPIMWLIINCFILLWFIQWTLQKRDSRNYTFWAWKSEESDQFGSVQQQSHRENSIVFGKIEVTCLSVSFGERIWSFVSVVE